MKHKSLLLAVFLLICGWAQATTQVRDKLYWNGIEYHTIPLVQIEKYFSQEEVNKLNKLGENWTTTVNYRAYQFIFEIDNDSLFLKAIVNDEEEDITESILGTQERRMMDNFSDTLFLGYGESVYEPAFWTLVYESEITVVFKNGVVQWFKDNKNKSIESRYYLDNLAVIKMLYSNIRWSSLDKETLQKKPEVILRIENDSVDKIENLSIIKSSGFAEFDEEVYRHGRGIRRGAADLRPQSRGGPLSRQHPGREKRRSVQSGLRRLPQVAAAEGAGLSRRTLPRYPAFHCRIGINRCAAGILLL